jgi:hypothetical protein
MSARAFLEGGGEGPRHGRAPSLPTTLRLKERSASVRRGIAGVDDVRRGLGHLPPGPLDSIASGGRFQPDFRAFFTAGAY